MTAIKKTEMKGMDETKAKVRLSELRTELMRLNAQVAVGSNIESPGRIKSARRNIARLLTHINNIKKNIKNKKEVGKKA